jgi:hypothetical protein
MTFKNILQRRKMKKLSCGTTEDELNLCTMICGGFLFDLSKAIE